MVTKTYFNLLVLGVVLLVLCMTFSTLSAEEINYESYNGFTTSEEPILPSNEVHPKLWFDSSEIEEVYEKRNADDYAEALWKSISESGYLGAELPTVPSDSCGDDRLHGYYGEMARIAKYNAFMFMMEGNEEYRQTAIDALLRAFDGPIYDCDPTISSSPVDETYRGIWIQHFSEAYDWMFSELTDEQHDHIRATLAKEAEMLNDNVFTWGPRPHNHRSKPAWGLGTVALVLSDNENASTWLETALKAANTNTKYFFSSDGVYREGSQYYIYSHLNLLPFLYHYKNVSNVDLFPTYKPAFIWEFSVSNNKGWMPNVEDSFLRHNFSQMVAGQFMNESDTTPLHPDAKWGNLFQWRYQQTDTTPWGGEFGNNTGASYDDSMDINKYLTYDPTVKPIKPTESATQFFNEGGQTIFRNHWNDEESARYLLFHGQADMDNHNHFDHLSFIIHAENQMMASDTGYSKSSYGDNERRTWYRTAEAHNTVTLNGAWPVDFEQNKTPISKYSMNTDFFDFQEKQARFIDIENNTSKGENPLLFPPDSESTGYINRSVAFPNQEYFVISDQLYTKDGTNGEFELFLHGGRGTMRGEGDFRQWTYSNDLYGSASKMASWILSNDAELVDDKGEITYVKGDAAEYEYVKAQKEGTNVNFMQILIPLSIDAKIPTVTNLSDDQRVGGTVSANGNLDTYILQNENKEVSLNEAGTNAEFSYVRQNGLVQQFAVKQGEFLNYREIPLFESTEKLTLTMDVSNHNYTKGYVSSNSDQYTMKLLIPEGKEVEKVVFDGTVIEFTQDGNYSVVNLSGSGAISIDYKHSSSVDEVSPASISNLEATGQGSGAVQLTWTASGDDGEKGQAKYYDVRYSLEPITEENWDMATKVTGEPYPSTPGSTETMLVEGLENSRTYYFAIKVGDESNNISLLSNITSAETEFAEDVTKPSTVMDLTVKSATHNSVSLSWSAPGDDEYIGVTEAYEIRYSTKPIDDSNWNQATKAEDVPTPLSVGQVQEMTIANLKPGQTYFFAMKSNDEAGNESAISNLAFGAILDDPNLNKVDVSNVIASTHDGNVPENTIDGDFTTRWSSEAIDGIGQWIQYDLGELYQVAYIKSAWSKGHLRQTDFSIHTSIDGENWTTVIDHELTSGMTEEFETYYIDKSARYIRIEGFGNTASGWNSLLETEIYGSVEVEQEPTVDVKELVDLIAFAKTITNKDGTYTKVSFDALNDAIVTAETARQKIETEDDLELAILALQAAINSLEEVQKDDDHQADQSKDVITKLGETIEVYPNKTVSVENTAVKIALPKDLPRGTKVTIEKHNPSNPSGQAIVSAGDVYTFTFEFPPGMESYTGKYLLTLGYDEEAYKSDEVAIYYFNETTEKWEHQGGEVKNGTITLEVNHFSTYGVFAAVQQNPGNQEESSDPVEQEDSNSQDEKEELNDPGEQVKSSDQDNKLPATATKSYSYLLIGFLLILGGAIVLFVRRKERKIE
ncbi:discoidin domain-containing protein [Bacillus weihaiensis]|uniref:discoidin domain-containing protein n=1 Tax=Bacillus weihaiensis TaxID=1547283 RepID=UPI002356BD49|nr:discoidin domain-containing protein [Bacillus weihaiensis]